MTEDQLENEALEWLGELGYTHLYGPDIAHDGDNPERESYRRRAVDRAPAPRHRHAEPRAAGRA